MRPVLGVAATSVAVATSVLIAPPGPVRAMPLALVDGETLDVAADRVEVDVERGTAVLEGNVSVTVGELELHCPSVEIRYDRSPRVSFARAKGGVIGRVKGVEVVSDLAEFDASSRKVTLAGGVRVSRGRGWIHAERGSFDLATSKVTLEEVKGVIPVEPPKR